MLFAKLFLYYIGFKKNIDKFERKRTISKVSSGSLFSVFVNDSLNYSLVVATEKQAERLLEISNVSVAGKLDLNSGVDELSEKLNL